MRIANVSRARSIWLFDTAELNPNGEDIVSKIYASLLRKYQFRVKPAADDILSAKDRRLAEGLFHHNGLSIPVALEYWSDGLVADTITSTEVSDAFLEDVISTLSKELQVKYHPNMIRSRRYLSELVVYADKGLVGICDRLDAFAKELGKLWPSQEVSAIFFGSESRPTAFTFERRANTSYEHNKFFSSAQMKTDTHSQLLDLFESIVLAERSDSVVSI